MMRPVSIVVCLSTWAFVQSALAIALDLTGPVSSGSIAADVGGTALFRRDHSHPTGTGVFNPFLTLQSAGSQKAEQAYHTIGRVGSQPPLDALRNHWNTDLTFGALQQVTVDGHQYYLFELDANEPGQGTTSRYMSLDNIRIYTSPIGGQTPANPDSLGVLRFALNPLGAYNNWVKIDSALGPTAGSGDSDLFVYIPSSAFAGVSASDFVYFYNLNGAHWRTDSGTGAEAGFEEWRALLGSNDIPAVPDASTTLSLLGIALLGLESLRRKSRSA